MALRSASRPSLFALSGLSFSAARAAGGWSDFTGRSAPLSHPAATRNPVTSTTAIHLICCLMGVILSEESRVGDRTPDGSAGSPGHAPPGDLPRFAVSGDLRLDHLGPLADLDAGAQGPLHRPSRQPSNRAA